jgi:YHS domain-containing protein
MPNLGEETMESHSNEQNKKQTVSAVTGFYACPMHPDVVSNEPGKCPKCGMDLVLNATFAEAKPKEIDPVCKMKVDPNTAKNILKFEGKNYYFCGKGCLEKFKIRRWFQRSPRRRTQNQRRLRTKSFTPVLCTPKSVKTIRGIVPSAAWRWNRWSFRRPARKRILNSKK